MTTDIECSAHPEGHHIRTGESFDACYALLGMRVVDNTDGDGLTYIYESTQSLNAVKRVKVGESLTGQKARLPARIISITVSE